MFIGSTETGMDSSADRDRVGGADSGIKKPAGSERMRVLKGLPVVKITYR